MIETAKQTVARQTYEDLEARVSPIVKHYREDLTRHDLQWIISNPGVPFVHFAREMGTHLWGLMPAEWYPPKGKAIPYLFGTAERVHILESVLTAVRYCIRSEVTQACHYYDGESLQRLQPAEVEECVEDYIQRIRREWDR
jgi:hypothetical protein